MTDRRTRSACVLWADPRRLGTGVGEARTENATSCLVTTSLSKPAGLEATVLSACHLTGSPAGPNAPCARLLGSVVDQLPKYS